MKGYIEDYECVEVVYVYRMKCPYCRSIIEFEDEDIKSGKNGLDDSVKCNNCMERVYISKAKKGEINESYAISSTI
jgi:hypothetical protein